ncbi:hypothetical protein [Vibrio harveyi]|uniref:hypothetical protein n=1 Tax=Vibrio harveyi TaxID=669 RepID=UPI00217E6C4F|nr:hypothetical protein [Vibrio harveyi]HEQ3591060.1 hypothetical protein [Vibrio harveyi]HEQ3599618.1 hypothetical protein [Vibrio harveyi]HEQ3611609.1 hypothetical protein [Vibrio harveyi]
MDINNVDFADEVVSSFSYDSIGKEMQLTFHSFMHKGKSVTKSHTLTISSWLEAQSRRWESTAFDDFEQHLGVPSLLLNFSFQDDLCSLVINTVDDRYIELKFYKAQIEFGESIIS